MKDQQNEKIKFVRDANRFIPDRKAAEERDLRRMHNARIRNTLFQEGYSLGVHGGDIDTVTDTVELDGKIVEKRSDPSFRGGYKSGLRDYQSKFKEEETHMSR